MSMRKFILKIVAISGIVVLIFLLMLICLPMDKDCYLREYNKKIELIKSTPSPRIILVGASTLAFGVDSKQISDSLGINVINMGLHAGIGARYYLDHYLQYIRQGDIVLMSPSYYADFIEGANGFPETMPDLMIATNWRNVEKLNIHQIIQLIKGTPFYCLRSILDLFKSPMNEFDPKQENLEFRFIASGFNEYGDEVSHWIIPSKNIKQNLEAGNVTSSNHIKVDESFMVYLKNAIENYKKKGAHVLLMPEISSHTNYVQYNPVQIEEMMKEYGMAFFTNPKNLEFNDSCSYDEWGAAHLSRDGVTLASERIAVLLQDQKTLQPLFDNNN